MQPTGASVLALNFFLLFQIIVIQKEPDHPSFLINIKSKGTFSSKKEPIGKVWYIATIICPKAELDNNIQSRVGRGGFSSVFSVMRITKIKLS